MPDRQVQAPETLEGFSGRLMAMLKSKRLLPFPFPINSGGTSPEGSDPFQQPRPVLNNRLIFRITVVHQSPRLREPSSELVHAGCGTTQGTDSKRKRQCTALRHHCASALLLHHSHEAFAFHRPLRVHRYWCAAALPARLFRFL